MSFSHADPRRFPTALAAAADAGFARPAASFPCPPALSQSVR